MTQFDESTPSDDDALQGGEFSAAVDGAATDADDVRSVSGTAESDLGDGSGLDDATGDGNAGAIRLDPDDAPTGDTTVGDTAAADAEFEGRPLSDAVTADDSATSADAGFGDTAPAGFSSDTEQTYAPADIQPESQGDDPVVAELGEDGEGDLSPEDL
ncbi:hypothetical protein AB3M83_04565 [Microbacterium sp. 179-B 1A2 NHS]|uniref:hypothetical protein n=1 Tax=Microbacterium sp. 179-B 1A2 NHS TaxID=3142383 RepID=UPI0039A3D85D